MVSADPQGFSLQSIYAGVQARTIIEIQSMSLQSPKQLPQLLSFKIKSSEINVWHNCKIIHSVSQKNIHEVTLQSSKENYP